LFLEQGAKISLKNNYKQSALHIAAKYGRKNSCLEFLKNGDFKLYVNEKDFEGNCPILKEFHKSSFVLIKYFNVCRFNPITFSFTR
jgi:ankyrin repeat protein